MLNGAPPLALSESLSIVLLSLTGTFRAFFPTCSHSTDCLRLECKLHKTGTVTLGHPKHQRYCGTE